ncbi:peptidyl-prolyl cis-trans isomerase [Candidatus Omnitrophota bacterium]
MPKVFLVIFGVFLLLSPMALSAQEAIVAIVNEDIITGKDLNDFFNFMRMQFSQEYQGKELEEKIQSMKLDLIDKLIEDRLILQQAKKSGLFIEEAKVSARIAQVRSRYASDADFQAALQAQGLVQADIEGKIRDQMLMFDMIEARVRARIKVKPSEVNDFYAAHKEEFNIPEQKEFKAVGTDDKAAAEGIFERAKGGGDFEAIAQDYSLSTNTMRTSGKEELREDIEKVILELEIGQVSAPVKIDDVYYVFKLVGLISPRQESIAEAQPKINAYLLELKMQEELARWLDEVKKESYIKVFQD